MEAPDPYTYPEIDAEIEEEERLEELARTQKALDERRDEVIRQEAEYRHYLLTNSHTEG